MADYDVNTHTGMVITIWFNLFRQELIYEKEQLEKTEESPIENYDEKFPYHALIDKFTARSEDALEYLTSFEDEQNRIQTFQTEEMIEAFRGEWSGKQTTTASQIEDGEDDDVSGDQEDNTRLQELSELQTKIHEELNLEKIDQAECTTILNQYRKYAQEDKNDSIVQAIDRLLSFVREETTDLPEEEIEALFMWNTRECEDLIRSILYITSSA